MDKLVTKSIWRKKDLLVKSDYLLKIVFKWFFADVAFTLLPILVILLIDYLTVGKLDNLRLSPIWSFATIVFMGLSITRLIELKTKYQRDLSHKVYTGTRLLTILLIFAVIILSLVVLRDKGLNINTNLLWYFQITLFCLSLMYLFMVNLHIEKYIEGIKIKKNLLLTITGREYFNFIHNSLEEIYEELNYLRFAIKRKPHAKFSEALNDEKKLELKFIFEKVDSVFIDVKSNFEAFINSPSPTIDQTLKN